MLDKTSITSLASSTPKIVGRALAHMRPSTRRRIAADLRDGLAILEQPTTAQIARLCDVLPAAVYQKSARRRRRQPPNEIMAQLWKRATPEQRVAFVSAVNVASVWD